MVFVGVVVGALMTARRARLLDGMNLFWRDVNRNLRLSLLSISSLEPRPSSAPDLRPFIHVHDEVEQIRIDKGLGLRLLLVS